MNAAPTASGVRLGDAFRVLAVAWDVVDSYGHRPLPAEVVPLVALALARYGMKFNLSSLQLDSLAKRVCEQEGVCNCRTWRARRVSW